MKATAPCTQDKYSKVTNNTVVEAVTNLAFGAELLRGGLGGEGLVVGTGEAVGIPSMVIGTWEDVGIPSVGGPIAVGVGEKVSPLKGVVPPAVGAAVFQVPTVTVDPPEGGIVTVGASVTVFHRVGAGEAAGEGGESTSPPQPLAI